MAKVAKVTLVGAESHKSSHWNFKKRGESREFTKSSDIEYFRAQPEFSVSMIEKMVVAGATAPAPKVQTPAEVVAAALPPWDDKMNKADLLAAAKARGLHVDDNDTRGALLEILRNNDGEDTED